MISQLTMQLVLVLVSCFTLATAQDKYDGLMINNGMTAGISLAMLFGILVTFTVTVNVIRYRSLKTKE
jgi:hypothetical protein